MEPPKFSLSTQPSSPASVADDENSPPALEAAMPVDDFKAELQNKNDSLASETAISNNEEEDELDGNASHASEAAIPAISEIDKLDDKSASLAPEVGVLLKDEKEDDLALEAAMLVDEMEEILLNQSAFPSSEAAMPVNEFEAELENQNDSSASETETAIPNNENENQLDDGNASHASEAAIPAIREIDELENKSASLASEVAILLKDEKESHIEKLHRFHAEYKTFLEDNSTPLLGDKSSGQFSSEKLRRHLRELYRRLKRFPVISCFALLLMPGFIQVACHYFFSRHVLRSIKYGGHRSHSLDLYLPKNRDGLKPVVAFITGGAWITGYKAWGSLLAQQLQDRDIMVACIHYRNIPGSTLNDMVEDVSQGIAFVFEHIIDEHGGDPNRIYVMGQQIGAYLAACSIIQQATKEVAAGNINNLSWRVSQIRRFFGLSGGYKLSDLATIFLSRGLYDSIKLCAREGEDSVTRFSPELLVVDAEHVNEHAVRILPTFCLFHGTGDHSIRSASSRRFQDSLRSAGVYTEFIWYDGKNDADLFLLDPMRGGIDELYRDLIDIVHLQGFYARASPRRRLLPECMVKLARRISRL